MNTKQKRIENLNLKIMKCNLCFDKIGKKTALGYGYLNAETFIVGESPSNTNKGIPFSGEYTKPIFDKMLEILGETRESVYTTNIIKCMIPHEKVGDPVKCRKFLEIELDIIHPKFVIICGRVAWKECFPNVKISSAGYRIGVDGRTYFYIPHPGAVLRGTIPQSLWEMYASQIRQHIQFFRKRCPDYVRIDRHAKIW